MYMLTHFAHGTSYSPRRSRSAAFRLARCQLADGSWKREKVAEILGEKLDAAAAKLDLAQLSAGSCALATAIGDRGPLVAGAFKF